VEDEAQANAVLAELKKKIRENRLQLVNLFVDKLTITDFQKLKVQFVYKGEVQYDDQLRPKRIINQHEDSPE
jgi:threonine aldolase